jgi:hypothetical protein
MEMFIAKYHTKGEDYLEFTTDPCEDRFAQFRWFYPEIRHFAGHIRKMPHARPIGR